MRRPDFLLLHRKRRRFPPSLRFLRMGKTAGAITAFDGDTNSLSYLDWMSTAAPYFARADSRRVCVLGAGGGANVLLALRHGARHVDAVELDANVVGLLRNNLRDFSGGLYNRTDVDVHIA